MNLIPTNPLLFWTLYVLGTFGPVTGILLLSRRHIINDRAFLLSWLLWWVVAGLLIACGWSVRAVLFRAANSRHPVWLYRSFGWLALLESLVWAYTVLRVV